MIKHSNRTYTTYSKTSARTTSSYYQHHSARLLVARILVISSILVPTVHATDIIWDIGGTLFEHTIPRIVLSLGPITSWRIYTTLKSQPSLSLRSNFLSILQDTNYTTNHAPTSTGALIPKDAYGNPLPPLMQDWFAGKITSDQAYNQAKALLKKKYPTLTKTQYKALERLTCWLFSPEGYTGALAPNPSAFILLRACAEKKDAHGNRANRIFVLSNFAAEPFYELYQKPSSRYIFQYIPQNHLIISGLVQDLKPYHSIFKKLLEWYQINPHNALFIDDQPENIKAAQEMGIPSILWSNKTADKLYNVLAQRACI